MALDFGKDCLSSWCLAQPVGWQPMGIWAADILPGAGLCAWGRAVE